MGGAGNNEPQSVDIFIEPIKIHCGELNYQNKITPVIKLRDILGKHTDGLLGNTHLLNTPLEINFSESYIKQLKEPLSADSLDRVPQTRSSIQRQPHRCESQSANRFRKYGGRLV